ncbi:MAG: hypothetical protein PHD30_09890, partial [Paludibacter sp.]|nr:hypothetical protein [Paludibacter sp.]
MKTKTQIKSFLVLFLSFSYLLSLQAQGKTTFQPAMTTSIVIDGNARFSMLTPHIIRLEYDSTGKFVDDPSFVVVNRKLPAIPYKKSVRGK